MEDPYGSLDPEGGTDGGESADRRAGGETPPRPPLYPEAGTLTTLLRGVRMRCPRCGERDTFVSWFVMRTACPRCEWRFEKEQGGYLGAMVLNYVVGIGLWIVVLVVGLALTVPDVPVLPLTIASVLVLVIVPLVFYPRSKTIWAAVEYLVLRADPDYHTPRHRDPRARDLE